MNPAAIAARVAYGYAKSGQKLGLPHALHRPTDPQARAIAPATLVRQVAFVASATPDAAFKRPLKPGDVDAFGLLDADVVRTGDYLVGPEGTWFVGATEALAVPKVVRCNAVARVMRTRRLAGGLTEDQYAGRTAATDGTLLSGWPVAQKFGGNSTNGEADLPGEPSVTGRELRVPAVPGVLFRTGDRVTLENADTLVVTGAILGPDGWVLRAALAEA